MTFNNFSLDIGYHFTLYHYIIDQSRISPRIFDRLLGEVYGFLTEYQISGEVHRVTRLRNLSELVEVALSSEAKTIVGVGDDATFLQLVELLAEHEDVVLGFIPLQYGSGIADILGLGDLQEACRAIAQRRLHTFSLGQISSLHFFNRIDFGPVADMHLDKEGYNWFKSFSLASQLKSADKLPLKVKVDKKFTIITDIIAGGVLSSQINDKLDLMLVSSLSNREVSRYKKRLIEGDYAGIPGATVLHGRTFEIDCPRAADVVIDSTSLSRLPAKVSVSHHRLNAIIGKGRES